MKSLWAVTCVLFATMAQAVFPLVGLAQRTPEEEVDRFQLFTNCAPLDLLVVVEGDALDGLTQESTTRAVRSRMRTARLYDEEAAPYLSVHIHVVGAAFSRSVRLRKRVFDPHSGVRQWATTWETSSTGTHGRTGGSFVLSKLSEDMDLFLDEYLRVNEAACARQAFRAVTRGPSPSPQSHRPAPL